MAGIQGSGPSRCLRRLALPRRDGPPWMRCYLVCGRRRFAQSPSPKGAGGSITHARKNRKRQSPAGGFRFDGERLCQVVGKMRRLGSGRAEVQHTAGGWRGRALWGSWRRCDMRAVFLARRSAVLLFAGVAAELVGISGRWRVGLWKPVFGHVAQIRRRALMVAVAPSQAASPLHVPNHAIVGGIRAKGVTRQRRELK